VVKIRNSTYYEESYIYVNKGGNKAETMGTRDEYGLVLGRSTPTLMIS